MKRVGFKPASPKPTARGKQWEGGEITPRRPVERHVAREPRMVSPISKENVIEHEGYKRIVRKMACAHCKRPGPSDFCHSDEGKGMRIKTDCRRGWPGCKDDLQRNRIGCHTLLGGTGTFTREQRRQLEAGYSSQTRAQVAAMGLWPADLPPWKE